MILTSVCAVSEYLLNNGQARSRSQLPRTSCRLPRRLGKSTFRRPARGRYQVLKSPMGPDRGRRPMRVICARAAVVAVVVAAGLAGPSALTAGQAEASAAPARTVAVSPAPGDRFATPQTTISFRGISPAALGPVRVTGSRSGVHAGSVVADPDGATIWKPRAPFAAGEHVTVRTSARIAGGSGGDSFSFAIARVAPGEIG